MKVTKIDTFANFKSKTDGSGKKREFIDIISDNVRNPRDVQDMVAVPRGIFKAYIYLMAGSSTLMISSALPQKWKGAKTVITIIGAILNAISAVYFAKPFAVKGLSPTTTREEVKNNNTK